MATHMTGHVHCGTLNPNYHWLTLAMAERPRWYPPAQVCAPPELPTYLKDVYDLKPIVGVPNDEEVIGIHSVIHAANHISVVPGMHNPSLVMSLADHLFSVQMARYRSKYSLITFPSDATYTPPILPAHVSVNLEPVSGAPTDEEMIKLQDAVQTYRDMRRFPSMFDAHVNMELSQHLFDLHMARHMRLAGESQPSLVSQESASPARILEQAPFVAGEMNTATNNAGTGADAAGVLQAPQMAPDIGRFNRVLERFAQLVEREHGPTDQSEQLVDRLNLLTEQSNQLAELSNRSFERSNQLLELASQPMERLEDVMKNINRVLVGIQHAIVRGYKGNTTSAVDCLVNEKGETPATSETTYLTTFEWLSKNHAGWPNSDLSVMIGGALKNLYVPKAWMAGFLCFYGLEAGMVCHAESGDVQIEAGQENVAEIRLSNYLSSCLG
ncbi:hypothetical protein RSAG8_08092, partial [Rhizoctonia solani AG-8 WAC10335]